MRLNILRAFSRLAIVVLCAVGIAVPLGLVKIPLEGYAPVLFYFSLILLLLTVTLSRLGLFFTGLVRDRAGITPDAPRYMSRIADKFIWPSGTLLLTSCLLFTASFVLQGA